MAPRPRAGPRCRAVALHRPPLPRLSDTPRRLRPRHAVRLPRRPHDVMK
jgi:hypothetical protein